MTNYAADLPNRKATSQSEQADPRQVENSAGGFVFAVDDWSRLERWLILGAEGGSYYASQKAMTLDSASVVKRCLDVDGPRTVKTIVSVSTSGRAPKNDPAIFALALAAAHTSPAVRALALASLANVCRTGTHLFTFVASANATRGWGRGLRRAIRDWYANRSADSLAMQVAKYQQRDGWSHRDLLRLSHATATDQVKKAVLRWAVTGNTGARTVRLGKHATSPTKEWPALDAALPRVIVGLERLRDDAGLTPAQAAQIIVDHGLTHEMVPSAYLAHAAVWEGLLSANMPLGALTRNLARMTANGLLQSGAAASKGVAARLVDGADIKRARLHPVSVLTALKTYASGRGSKGSLTWAPVPKILDALDDAFYLAFGAVEPVGKPVMLALDVSGSMAGAMIAGSPLTAREASAAMAMVTARVEPDYDLVGFAAGAGGGYGGQWGGTCRLVPLGITAKTALPDVVKAMEAIPMGATDCALPMLHALERSQKVDGFVVYTDSETWHGAVHPYQALRKYRAETGQAAKLAVVATSATAFTIADPTDGGMMDVVGFDTAAPTVIADFLRGRSAEGPID